MGEPHQSRVYSDLARFYDHTFGRIFVDHEHEIIEQLNLRPEQQVLEVGVGTGISLDAYPAYVHVVGIDPSADMLALAIKKTRENGWGHIDVRQGDAHEARFSRQQLRLGDQLSRDDGGARSAAHDAGDGAGV